jgi:hypothetical protein
LLVLLDPDRTGGSERFVTAKKAPGGLTEILFTRISKGQKAALVRRLRREREGPGPTWLSMSDLVRRILERELAGGG